MKFGYYDVIYFEILKSKHAQTIPEIYINDPILNGGFEINLLLYLIF